MAKRLIGEHPPTHVIIEDAANGAPLIQALSQMQGFVTEGIRPTLDKETRANAASPMFEAGRVFIPANVPWRLTYLQELTGFPGTRFDDQVDSTTQFINWAEERLRVNIPNAMPWGLERDDSWLF